MHNILCPSVIILTHQFRNVKRILFKTFGSAFRQDLQKLQEGSRSLGEIEPGKIRLLGEPGDGHVTAVEHIPFGHKFALRALRAGDPVIKYGARIGTATQDIVPGEHVHLHNMRSDFDERASTLDAETALPEDVVYELY